jgi:UDP-N-acetylmuramoyl-L-alanyl-D-glutamate--2,6-diaminopimelate ligase
MKPTGTPPKPLVALLLELPTARLLSGEPQVQIHGIAFDSRTVQPGDLFVAVPGFKHDGRDFVPQALARGAGAIVSQAPVPECAAARIEVENARVALADFAAAFYEHPSNQLTLVGVTGTDGKTTTTRLLAAVLESAGQRTGWLSTVDVQTGADCRANDLRHTTPEAVGVQAFLRELAEAGTQVCVLEVSSHALALERVRGCEFDVAVFTNLSSEHLNFHGTLERYLQVKARLFEMLDEPSTKHGPRFGVINVDDPAAPAIRAACPVPVVTYGLDQPADVTAQNIELSSLGTRFLLSTPAGRADLATRLIGRFNVSNWLAAAAAAHALGVGPEVVARAAAALPPLRGRMQPLERGQPFAVFVDFAHTPQALETALRTLRQQTPGRLLLVFGNAGERDPASRPAMGRVAAALADFFVISMDDPLHEDPAEIASAVAEGARQAGAVEGSEFEIELDRRRAIRLLFQRARPGDTVLLAGKGHETRMLVGDQRLPWDDRRVAEELLDKLA